jgi:hypothetical protein
MNFNTDFSQWYYLDLGSSGNSVRSPRFGGVSMRTHAHTPKSGVPPQDFPETLDLGFLGNMADFHAYGWTKPMIALLEIL